MKQHKVSLELVAKKLGALAQSRLPIMYDTATLYLNEQVKKSISNEQPFKMHVAQLDVPDRFKAVRVTDIETGQYVKLVRDKADTNPRMEVGMLFSVEEYVQGQSNSRAW